MRHRLGTPVMRGSTGRAGSSAAMSMPRCSSAGGSTNSMSGAFSKEMVIGPCRARVRIQLYVAPAGHGHAIHRSHHEAGLHCSEGLRSVGEVLLRYAAEDSAGIGRHAPDAGNERESDNGEQEIHDDAGGDDEGPDRERLRLEVAGPPLPLTRHLDLADRLVVALQVVQRDGASLDLLHLLHAGHLDVAAQRQGRDDVLGLAAAETDDAGAEADGEARHLDVGPLRRHEMTKLVDEDEHAQYNDEGQDRQHVFLTAAAATSRAP
jgi:hypothetical protein